MALDENMSVYTTMYIDFQKNSKARITRMFSISCYYSAWRFQYRHLKSHVIFVTSVILMLQYACSGWLCYANFMLCYASLCSSTNLRYAMLYVMVCYVIPCCAVLYYFASSYVIYATTCYNYFMLK